MQGLIHRKVSIVGVGMTLQGQHGDTSALVLGLRALKDAMADASIEDKQRIDCMLGAKQYDGSGIDAVAFCRQLGITPAHVGALDYPVAGFTVQYGAMLIASGACNLVAVVYARNPSGSMRGISGAQDYDLSHGFVNAAASRGPRTWRSTALLRTRSATSVEGLCWGRARGFSQLAHPRALFLDR